MRAAYHIILTFFLSLAGCALPQPPPAMSMAKFARPPADKNRLGFSTGVAMHLNEDEDATLVLFPVEGGLGLSLGDRYDLGVTVGNFMGTAEGNYALIDGNLRLGLLHGLGLGMLSSQSEQAALTQLTAGSFLQTGRENAFFMGLKYTYAAAIGSDVFHPTHYLTGSIGFLPPGVVKVTPELAINHGRWSTPGIDGDELNGSWTVVIGVTVLTHYDSAALE